MKSNRANFAHVVFDNSVYVFGGLAGKQPEPESHVPLITNTISEKYDVNSDTWEEI